MFVQRDGSGKINGVFAKPQAGYAEEELADDHPEVIEFFNPPITPIKAIVNIEQQNPITHRALREFFIGFGAVNPSFQATLLYQRAKAVDDAIKVERAKL